MQHLLDLGFGPTFLSQLDLDDLADPPVGRVTFEAHGHVRLLTVDGERAAILDSALRDRYDRVVVGDWVVFDRRYDPLVVVRRLERLTTLRRRDPDGSTREVAANLDRALICTAIGRDFNVRRLERWLLMVTEADIDPVVVLTKADQGADVDGPLAEARAVALGHPVLAVSAVDGVGLDALRAQLEPGRTAALLGTSGVGKSTLVNALSDVSVQAVGAVRADDERGRHTTTARHLFRLPSGAWLLDNPGVRTVGVVDGGELSSVFPEIEALAESCRYRDCGHAAEPGCAVREAVEGGELPEGRFAAWRKLQRERAWEARRDDPEARRAERARWKAIHKSHRQRDKARGKPR